MAKPHSTASAPNFLPNSYPPRVDIVTIAGLVAIGFVGGVFGSLVGLGGATFIIPLAMLSLTLDTQQLRAATMLSNMFVAIGAIVPYARAGQVDWRTVRLIAPWAAATVAIGVWLSVGIDTVLYRGLFGVFVLVIVGRELSVLLKKRAQVAEERALSARAGGATGTIAGLASGVLSVGGGVVFMPVLREWIGMPVKRAAATSMVMVLPTVAVGSAAQLWSMSQLPAPTEAVAQGVASGVASGLATSAATNGASMLPGALAIAACLCPAALAGGWTGARLNARIPKVGVQWAVVVALSIAGIMLLRPLLDRLSQ